MADKWKKCSAHNICIPHVLNCFDDLSKKKSQAKKPSIKLRQKGLPSSISLQEPKENVHVYKNSLILVVTPHLSG